MSQELPYKDPSLPVDDRVSDLLSRMTLEEKAAQMVGVWNDKAKTLIDEQGRFDEAKARASYERGYGLGQVGRPSDSGGGIGAREQAVLTNEIQHFFVTQSRLGIPVIFHEECLHGQAAPEGTSFPQPIGLGATFDEELVEALYAMTALEARKRGTHQALTPVVDVARDPRWGRVEETFGEDPWLVGSLGMAAVRGFQGDGMFRGQDRVLATLKHFAAHGDPEGGMNCAPANVSERELRDVFLEPFRRAIQDAGCWSVMASYNEIDGVPSHASTWLLRDVLRGEWGFEGFIVSDYYAIWELSDRPDTHGHHLAADRAEACRLAVRAGVNIELPEPDCYRSLAELVRAGLLAEEALDELVAPMLRAKFVLGLFDDPYVDPEEAHAVVRLPESRDLVRRAAQRVITLLENRNDTLPLAADSGTIALIGPNADKSLLGGYSGKPMVDVSVLEGLRDAYNGEILYAQGCHITVDPDWNKDEVELASEEADRALIEEAVAAARKSDVVVMALGGNEQTSREAWALNHMGDRSDLQLFGRQLELFDAVRAVGKPVVVILFGGRPLVIDHLAEHADALLIGWYLGQEAGHAVADVLFGAVNPGGKLPISFPCSVGQVPIYYNHKPSARRGYLFDDARPLYPFGFGRSYTTFDVSAPTLADEEIAVDGSTSVTVTVTNTGSWTGDEVVQLYIRDRVSSVTRPVRELKGFKRITLRPGASTEVTLPIGMDQLAFHDIEKKWSVETGQFDIMVGTSSRKEDLKTTTLTVV